MFLGSYGVCVLPSVQYQLCSQRTTSSIKQPTLRVLCRTTETLSSALFRYWLLMMAFSHSLPTLWRQTDPSYSWTWVLPSSVLFLWHFYPLLLHFQGFKPFQMALNNIFAAWYFSNISGGQQFLLPASCACLPGICFCPHGSIKSVQSYH